MKANLGVTRAQTAHLSCAYCYRRSAQLLSKCTKCKRVAYCDKDCQKKDWKDHKGNCQQLQKVNAYDLKKGHTLLSASNRLQYYVSEEQSRCEIYISAAADPYSSFPDIITTGMKCQVCFRTPFHDDKHRFSPCEKCRLAWWCSSQCEKLFCKTAHTKEHCADLLTVAAVQDLRVAHELTGTSRPIALRTMHARTSYIAPSSLSDWADYHERVFPDFATGVQLFARQFQGNHPDAEHAARTIFIDSTSIVLTLLAAMEHTIPNLQMRSKLCVHIVAAAHKEFNTQDMMEELLHYLPKLETVVIVYIGPTLPTVSTASQNHACYGCRQSRRRRTVILCPTTYHEFAESAKYRANPPDLVAGFNTGMGEVGVSGWEKSMRVVLESNVPAVFTTYTVFEALNDTNMLTELGASFVKTLEKNLWRGVIPLIAERIEVHGLDHFSNNYWFIVRGRL